MQQDTCKWVSEQCLTSPQTQYRLYGRRFLQVKRPNQQYQSTEGKDRIRAVLSLCQTRWKKWRSVFELLTKEVFQQQTKVCVFAVEMHSMVIVSFLVWQKSDPLLTKICVKTTFTLSFTVTLTFRSSNTPPFTSVRVTSRKNVNFLPRSNIERMKYVRDKINDINDKNGAFPLV